MKPQIWFATYTGLPDLDPDDVLVAEELSWRGYKCLPKIWNDPDVLWQEADLVVVRSTWDYHLHFEAFENWLAKPELANKLWNPPALMRWNSHKSYLRELEQAGIDIVPTIFFDRGTPPETLLRRARETSWNSAIIKPAVGLSTFGVSKVDLSEENPFGQQCVELVAERDMMLQPFMEEVQNSGERSLIFIDGRYSHAIRKVPFQKLAVAGHAGETFIEAESDEVELGGRTMQAISQQTLYARVDVIRDGAGKPRVMELELVEPSLFLQFSVGAVIRFADAVESALARTTGVCAFSAVDSTQLEYRLR